MGYILLLRFRESQQTTSLHCHASLQIRDSYMSKPEVPHQNSNIKVISMFNPNIGVIIGACVIPSLSPTAIAGGSTTSRFLTDSLNYYTNLSSAITEACACLLTQGKA